MNLYDFHDKKICHEVSDHLLKNFTIDWTMHIDFCCRIFILFTFEPSHEKTNNLHMRKQRRRSAVQ